MMSLHAIGERELAAIDGARGLATEAAIREISPMLADNLVQHAFGRVFARTTLSRRDREMASVAILAAMGACEPQLDLHIEAALRVGADRDELIALAEHLSVYAGYPRSLNMLRSLRAALEAADLTPAGALRTERIRDMETTVFDSRGEGPVMLLVHALGLDWRMWRDVIPHLTSRFRVIAPDLRGFGSAGQARPATGINDYAADLKVLIDMLTPEPIHVAGLSLGGTVALQLASEHPGRLSTLSVIAATAWPFPAFGEREEAARRNGMAAQIAPSLTRWFRASDLAENGWAVRYARDCVERAELAGWTAGWQALASVNVAATLPTIAVPTQIIAGEVDASTPPDLMRGMLTIKASTFDVVPDAPHMLALTHPDQLGLALGRHGADLPLHVV